MKFFHKSVLLNEVIDCLQVRSGQKYIDATLGGGGHAEAILKLGGEVLGIDVDKEAIDYVQRKLKKHHSEKLKIVQRNFRDIDKIARSQGFEKVAGIIFDLGVSSHQLKEGQRGFSFSKEGPLDMRMDINLPIKASDLINLASKDELFEIFTKFGEEKRAFAIANAFVRARLKQTVQTTGDLLKVIKGVYGIKDEISEKRKAEIAKRVFQALRIAVNDELESLRESLPKALGLLERKGRVAVVTFHSLEDRIVKENFKDFERNGLGKIVGKGPIIPSFWEISKNPRARSAKLRVFSREAGSR